MVDTRPYVVVLVVFPTVLGTRLLTMHNIKQYFVHYILFPHLVVMYIGYESLLTFKREYGDILPSVKPCCHLNVRLYSI